MKLAISTAVGKTFSLVVEQSREADGFYWYIEICEPDRLPRTYATSKEIHASESSAASDGLEQLDRIVAEDGGRQAPDRSNR